MKTCLKSLVRATPLYGPLRTWAVKRAARNALADWEAAGRPLPPPHIAKQMTLKEYATRYGLKTLVETGTYYGDMVEAMRSSFDVIYSIELSEELHRKAVRRFRRDEHVRLIHGDSGAELARVVRALREPALFWLDGHYSGEETAKGECDTPILAELEHVLTAGEKRHVIIIDDARLFGDEPGYPTVEQLAEFVHSLRPDVDVAVRDDSIRITP